MPLPCDDGSGWSESNARNRHGETAAAAAKSSASPLMSLAAAAVGDVAPDARSPAISFFLAWAAAREARLRLARARSARRHSAAGTRTAASTTSSTTAQGKQQQTAAHSAAVPPATSPHRGCSRARRRSRSRRASTGGDRRSRRSSSIAAAAVAGDGDADPSPRPVDAGADADADRRWPRRCFWWLWCSWRRPSRACSPQASPIVPDPDRRRRRSQRPRRIDITWRFVRGRANGRPAGGGDAFAEPGREIRRRGGCAMRGAPPYILAGHLSG
ncbi:hypothetical protein BDA96_08G194500 [Sorghum bicolor]|uniref:Uncharacterized protein n=2 Tax=Sorghum bicolor TaxID=4558 RepID=A0A921QGM2_SORBI|nr:hypothetical protein BDA96_08G194500 [Sorghum bicolor]OQU79663.1 hypothetical protein SORBI_3008G176401 [Sorghum bicolor]